MSGGTVTFSVTLDQDAPPSGVNVAFTLADGTATGGGVDYSENTVSPLFIAGGSSTGNIVININNDTEYEEAENFTITINPDGNKTVSGSPATCTITDDGDT